MINTSKLTSNQKWICCQIGAREHYAIPRALHQCQQLGHLITDAWIPSNSGINFLPRSVIANLRERFHPDLAQASVYTFTPSLLNFELTQKLKKKRNGTKLLHGIIGFKQKLSNCFNPLLLTFQISLLFLLIATLL